MVSLLESLLAATASRPLRPGKLAAAGAAVTRTSTRARTRCELACREKPLSGFEVAHRLGSRAVSLALVLAVVGAALPSQYTIPGDGVFPEGVSLRPGTDQFFVSSTGNGTIYRGTLGKPRLKVFLPPGG